MRNFILLTSILLIISCESGIEEDFKATYQEKFVINILFIPKIKTSMGIYHFM